MKEPVTTLCSICNEAILVGEGYKQIMTKRYHIGCLWPEWAKEHRRTLVLIEDREDTDG